MNCTKHNKKDCSTCQSGPLTTNYECNEIPCVSNDECCEKYSSQCVILSRDIECDENFFRKGTPITDVIERILCDTELPGLVCGYADNPNGDNFSFEKEDQRSIRILDFADFNEFHDTFPSDPFFSGFASTEVFNFYNNIHAVDKTEVVKKKVSLSKEHLEVGQPNIKYTNSHGRPMNINLSLTNTGLKDDYIDGLYVSYLDVNELEPGLSNYITMGFDPNEAYVLNFDLPGTWNGTEYEYFFEFFYVAVDIRPALPRFDLEDYRASTDFNVNVFLDAQVIDTRCYKSCIVTDKEEIDLVSDDFTDYEKLADADCSCCARLSDRIGDLTDLVNSFVWPDFNYIAYADDANGAGLTFDGRTVPKKCYMAIYSSSSEVNAAPGDIPFWTNTFSGLWSYRCDPPAESYTYVAYASNELGDNFSATKGTNCYMSVLKTDVYAASVNDISSLFTEWVYVCQHVPVPVEDNCIEEICVSSWSEFVQATTTLNALANGGNIILQDNITVIPLVLTPMIDLRNITVYGNKFSIDVSSEPIKLIGNAHFEDVIFKGQVNTGSKLIAYKNSPAGNVLQFVRLLFDKCKFINILTPDTGYNSNEPSVYNIEYVENNNSDLTVTFNNCISSGNYSEKNGYVDRSFSIYSRGEIYFNCFNQLGVLLTPFNKDNHSYSFGYLINAVQKASANVDNTCLLRCTNTYKIYTDANYTRFTPKIIDPLDILSGGVYEIDMDEHYTDYILTDINATCVATIVSSVIEGKEINIIRLENINVEEFDIGTSASLTMVGDLNGSNDTHVKFNVKNINGEFTADNGLPNLMLTRIDRVL